MKSNKISLRKTSIKMAKTNKYVHKDKISYIHKRQGKYKITKKL